MTTQKDKLRAEIEKILVKWGVTQELGFACKLATALTNATEELKLERNR